MSHPFQFAALTDIGRERLKNEDALFVDPALGLFIVADGMGGHNAGEVASALAVKVIREELTARAPFTTDEQTALELDAALYAAHTHIRKEADTDKSKKRMGTTAVVGLVCGLRLFVACVGDSRVYVQREYRLVRVTRDQTVLNASIDAKTFPDEETARRRMNAAIAATPNQALGVVLAEVVITVVNLRRGDRVLFCSDGLTGPLSDEFISEILRAQPEPAAACGQLVQDANNAGGPDNVTTIVVNFDGEQFPPPTPEDVTGLKREVFLLPEF